MKRMVHGTIIATTLFLTVFSTSQDFGMVPETGSQEPANLMPEAQDSESLRIRTLIGQLSSLDFGTREMARQQLLAIGADCLPMLREYRDANDSELRLSAARLVEEIVRDTGRQRINMFLDNRATLPGWKEFQTHFGDSPGCRKLFAELFQAEQPLLEQLAAPGNPRSALLAKWLDLQKPLVAHDQQLQRHKLLGLALLVAELFGRTDRDIESVPLQTEIALGQLLSQPGREHWSDDLNAGPVLRQALAVWVTAPAENPIVLSARISVASRFQIDESLPTCLQCLDMPDIPAVTRRTAIELLVRFGNEEHCTALEQHFDDRLLVFQEMVSTPESPSMAPGTCLMGDIALAGAVLLSGQDLKRYEFSKAGSPQLRSLPPPADLVVTGEAARQSARKKWRIYRRDHESPKNP